MTLRLKRLQISDEFLLDLFSSSQPAREITENALPADAALVDIRREHRRGVVELLVSSASYPEVPAGSLPPLMPDPVFLNRP